jgi:hypothetical protein
MTVVNMLLIDATCRMASGRRMLNPVANQPPGTSQALYYLIIARQRRRAEIAITHAIAMTGAYSMLVTNPGGSGGLGVCES